MKTKTSIRSGGLASIPIGSVKAERSGISMPTL